MRKPRQRKACEVVSHWAVMLEDIVVRAKAFRTKHYGDLGWPLQPQCPYGTRWSMSTLRTLRTVPASGCFRLQEPATRRHPTTISSALCKIQSQTLTGYRLALSFTVIVQHFVDTKPTGLVIQTLHLSVQIPSQSELFAAVNGILQSVRAELMLNVQCYLK